jgi:periplasmic protein TonB
VDTVYNEVDVEPEFKGGDMAWKRYLLKNFNLDKINEKMTVTELLGCKTYILKFIVTIDGSIAGIEFENEVPVVLKDEISKLLKESPKWTPAFKNGKNVNAYKRQPISILIEN